MTQDELRTKLQTRADAEGGPKFMGFPDRWWDDPTFRCVNNHVSKSGLKVESRGALCCLAAGCREVLWLTFPEDQEGSAL